MFHHMRLCLIHIQRSLLGILLYLLSFVLNILLRALCANCVRVSDNKKGGIGAVVGVNVGVNVFQTAVG